MNLNLINETLCSSSDALSSHKELQLVESLSAVTTHFVQVQFRLKQIINAPLEEKESLLKDLEEFSFKGIPVTQNVISDSTDRDNLYKYTLITNLRNQIVELENIINNLSENLDSKTSNLDANNQEATNRLHVPSKIDSSHNKVKPQLQNLNIIKRLLSVLHIINTHCKEGKEHIEKELLSKKVIGNDWGDARLQLQTAVFEILKLSSEPEFPIDSDYMSDSDDGTFYASNQKLISVVRKKLAPAIQSLMQHGLQLENKVVSLRNSFVIGCFPRINNSPNAYNSHAWQLILHYYKIKNGDELNAEPALKLSQSFNMDIGSYSTNSNSQKLLITISNIMTTHSIYKRSFNSQFKAFICAALNANMLVTWLKLIYRCKQLIEKFYQPWSYAVKPGFEDAYKSLEKLHQCRFNLPVDVAIQQLENIKDAF